MVICPNHGDRLVEFYRSQGHGDAQADLERWYDTAERAKYHIIIMYEYGGALNTGE